MDGRRDRGGYRAEAPWWSRLLIGGGAIATVAGFAFGLRAEGDVATGLGVLAGAGMVILCVGLMKLWIDHEVRARANDPGGASKRERLQAQRTRQLWVLPFLSIFLLSQAAWIGLPNILSGAAEFRDYLSLLLPVLYAWVVTAMVMGWDGQTRQNRRWLEDELTQVIRARALSAAFSVLMAGATIALGIGFFWNPDYGVVASLFAITAASATAGLRFVWLDREFGKDG